MAKYSSLERSIARYLRRFPAIKLYVKTFFQAVMRFQHKNGYRFRLLNNAVELRQVDDFGETFFGYFAQPVLCEGKLLYHCTRLNTAASPKKYAKTGGSIEIVCRRGMDGPELYRSTSRAFNWQQGSKLSWVDGRRFIYNDLDVNGRVIAKLVDIGTGAIQTLPLPVYEVIDPVLYVSLDFDSLTRLSPDYGYHQSVRGNEQSYMAVCTFDGEVVFRRSISEINSELGISGDVAEHSLNHASVAPDGQRMVVIHRSFPNGIRVDRLLYLDLTMPVPRIVSVVDSGMVSHYDWASNQALVCYMRQGSDEAYFLIELINQPAKIGEISLAGLRELGDGHPVCLNEEIFVTDTYPDKAGMKKLVLVDLKVGATQIIGEFHEPLKLSPEGRCDLHPRYDPEGGVIFFDSDHTGERRLYAVSLPEPIVARLKGL